MINYHAEIVSALNTVLPTYYEMALTSTTQTPCISYMEINNYTATETVGATVGYNYITYQVKVWSNKVADLQEYSLQIDNVLRALGFKRISSGELYDINSTMMQKVLTYEAVVYEKYNN